MKTKTSSGSRTPRPYFYLICREEDGKWSQLFGDYDRSVVEEERKDQYLKRFKDDDLRYRSENMKIVTGRVSKKWIEGYLSVLNTKKKDDKDEEWRKKEWKGKLIDGMDEETAIKLEKRAKARQIAQDKLDSEREPTFTIEEFVSVLVLMLNRVKAKAEKELAESTESTAIATVPIEKRVRAAQDLVDILKSIKL